MEYHELETFNGDSSSITVTLAEFSMENLQPGRNYSIAVRAVSNGIESVSTTAFQATREYSSFRLKYYKCQYNAESSTKKQKA